MFETLKTHLSKIAGTALLAVMLATTSYVTHKLVYNDKNVASNFAHPSVIVKVYDPSLQVYAPMWQKEIDRRFDNAVGILVHGIDLDGEWYVGTQRSADAPLMKVQKLVAEVQAEYPDRTVVLLACNTGHLKLNMPGVYYAMASVWCVPDRAITAEMYRNGLAEAKFKPRCSCLPATQPTIQPAAAPRPTLPAVVTPQPTRWEVEPDVVGNIYEMVCE